MSLASRPLPHVEANRPVRLGAINSSVGRYGAGIIPDVSLCSRGEALGHYAWIDTVMLQQIVDAANARVPLAALWPPVLFTVFTGRQHRTAKGV